MPKGRQNAHSWIKYNLMPNCSQCGKVAVAQAGDVPLCVDCVYKLQLAEYYRRQGYAQRMNFVLEQAEMITGISGGPRVAMPPPPPILRTGPMTFNNIRVDRSVVAQSTLPRLSGLMSH